MCGLRMNNDGRTVQHVLVSDASLSAPETLRVAWGSVLSRLLNVAVAGQHSFLAFSKFRIQISAR